MNKIKKNDTVQILAGKDKGKVGKVVAVLDGGKRVTVEKCNMVKRHQRPNQTYRTGGIIDMEAPLDISNVALVNRDGERVRVSFKEIEGDGGTKRRVRYSRKHDQVLD